MLLRRRILLKVENKYFSLSLNLSQDIAINSRVLASWKYFDISVSKLFHITLRSSSPTDSEQFLLSVNFHTLIIKNRLPLLWLFTIFTVYNIVLCFHTITWTVCWTQFPRDEVRCSLFLRCQPGRRSGEQWRFLSEIMTNIMMQPCTQRW